MPAAARLLAAILPAACAWIGSGVICAPALPGGSNPTWFAPMVGWRMIGANAVGGMRTALGHGIEGALTPLIAVHAAWKMLLRSMALRHDGPIAAVTATPVIALDDLARLADTPGADAAPTLGGVMAGVLSELTERVWK